MTEAATHHVTCPQEIRAINHHGKTAKWWNEPEYRVLSDAFLRAHPVCEYCGGKATVVHHDSRDSYRSREEYFNLDKNGTAACWRCHDNYRMGRIICPVCRKHYMARDGPHDRCRFCRATPGGSKRGGKKAPRHPCGNRIGQQRCQRNGRCFVCAVSSKNARSCDYFRERNSTPA